jgi:hypothetical protein
MSEPPLMALAVAVSHYSITGSAPDRTDIDVSSQPVNPQRYTAVSHCSELEARAERKSQSD